MENYSAHKIPRPAFLQWLEDLRNPPGIQIKENYVGFSTTECRRKNRPDCFCAAGLLKYREPELFESTYRDDPTSNLISAVVNMNDSQSKTFSEIADFLQPFLPQE